MKKILIPIFSILIGYYANAQDIEDLFFGTDSTFEVLTWNIEWFPKNGQITIDFVTQIIEELEVDVLALQEISDTLAFKQVLESLNGYNGFIKSSWYAGLAYIYNTESILINDIYEIYISEPYWSTFPRSPVVMELSYLGENFIVINNHFKCCGDGFIDLSDEGDEETRRFRASNLLKEYIDTYFQNENVILTGDLNDIITDNEENNVFQAFIDDSANYYFADMNIALESSSGWSYPSWPSHLDHILISNELFDEFENENSEIKTIKIDNYLAEGWDAYEEDISDHRPVAIKIKTNIVTYNNQINTEASVFTIYPNPIHEKAIFNFTKVEKNAELIVYNYFGSKIQSVPIKAGESKITLNTEISPQGIYFAVLKSREKILGKLKIIKL